MGQVASGGTPIYIAFTYNFRNFEVSTRFRAGLRRDSGVPFTAAKVFRQGFIVYIYATPVGL
tara:strand:+ start:89 stop:274 length:186 start_codon:yes stop_codon:yes gene_type:complete